MKKGAFGIIAMAAGVSAALTAGIYVGKKAKKKALKRQEIVLNSARELENRLTVDNIHEIVEDFFKDPHHPGLYGKEVKINGRHYSIDVEILDTYKDYWGTPEENAKESNYGKAKNSKKFMCQRYSIEEAESELEDDLETVEYHLSYKGERLEIALYWYPCEDTAGQDEEVVKIFRKAVEAWIDQI